ncbi:hypothetical protein AZE42_01247 [Rhizopogon vesiculosus]|uniref:Uncharacterized protein n=1 Tax=Rhizopogon vesiculosus TaxID=180088 RepID=A0A1J8QYY9_9AGAM|nr:hypothetical protein AZE42_01247 [Rhizopogon vesiculosus]
MRLDDSEKPLGTGEEDNRVYRFRGILSIVSPLWLSEVGSKRVEGELNLRARMRSIREGERAPPDMTLEELFNGARGYLGRKDHLTDDDEKLELKLKIQGFKNMPAVYMLSKEVPHGLLWTSKDCDRRYEIATMDSYTFQHSENFFWRYRLLALMKKIVEEDPRRTSLEKRTPEWFVSQYIQRFAHPPNTTHKRLIYDSDDSDVSDDGTTHLPRHPRRIHKSDILRLFATQSEWFVTDNEVKRSKLLPSKPWDQFRKAVRKARWQGWPIGGEHNPDLELEPDREEVDELEDDNDDDDDTMDLVARNPVIGKTNETVRRKIDKAKTERNLPPNRRIVFSPSSSSSSDETDPVTAHAYISDFSEDSSATASDSSVEVVDARLRGFRALIPPQLFQVPDLPGPDNRWWCRVPHCDYLIDMQDLKEENVQGLSGDSVFYLMEKRWRSIQEDKKAQSCFFEMASVHYKTHLERLDLKLVQTGGKVGVDWIKHRRRDQHRCGAVGVKEEEDT